MTDQLNDRLLELHKRVLRARRATPEERKELLYDGNEEVLHGLLDNQELNEEELLLMAQRKDLSSELLRRMGGDSRVTASYQLKRALVLNPKMPASISLNFLGQLFLFDVMSTLLVPAIPREVKAAGEEMLCRKYPQMALGERLTMARRTNCERLLSMLLDDASREVVAAVLTNSFLRENAVCAALRKSTIKSHTVELVAANAKWSCRYDVRYALLRTRHLSLGSALNFLGNLMAKDLRDLASDPSVSMQIRNYIKSNLSKSTAGQNQKPR
jgi:hypothetical protein